MSNLQMHSFDVNLKMNVLLCMILCIVGIEIVLRLLLLSTLLTNSLNCQWSPLSIVVVEEEEIVIATTVHQSKLMFLSFSREYEESWLE
jgi:hypothetical protein